MRFSSRLRHCAVSLLTLSSVFTDVLASNVTARILPASFSPPAVFENTNLVRNVNLERSYPRETTNIVVKNIAKEAQTQYYLQFPTALVQKVSGLDVKDKKSTDGASFSVELAQYAAASSDSYYIITFPQALKPSDSITISVSYALLSTVQPLPALIEQLGQQTITYGFSAYFPSAYKTLKQKTKLKLPSTNAAEFTKLPEKNADGASDPIHQGNSLTYGPYNDLGSGSSQPVSVRYDFTKPLIHATRFERDIEVSHWGGNLAVEERYWLTNRAAKLKKHFSRVQHQMSQYANPPSSAAKDMRLVLSGEAANPYYIDDIGNVSTSKFRPGRREAFLDIKPRYPIFGGWNYSFKVGWDVNLLNYLRRGSGESYVLKVPFMEGPRTDAGVEYESAVIRVILPEGATNVKYTTPLPISDSYVTSHKTFMDTKGRPTVILTAHNVIEEWRDRGSLIITYDYPWLATFRKPLTIAVSTFGVFFAAWAIGNLDVRIGKKY